MKFRKYAAIALAGAMCMSLLAGCGDKKDDTSKDSTTASNAEVTSGESTDASAEEENIKATITVWGPAEDQSPDYGEWLQEDVKHLIRNIQIGIFHLNMVHAARQMQERP